eukprot:Skav220740  [mRNA]  locus=scaffold2753:348149:348617:- [translate_table: standard]
MFCFKYFAAGFLLTLELTAAVRPAHTDLEKAAHTSEHLKVHEKDHEDSGGKPCCGCKVKKDWTFTRVCENKPKKYDMVICAGDRGTSCDGHFTLSDGEYSCWTKTSGCAAPKPLP